MPGKIPGANATAKEDRPDKFNPGSTVSGGLLAENSHNRFSPGSVTTVSPVTPVEQPPVTPVVPVVEPVVPEVTPEDTVGAEPTAAELDAPYVNPSQNSPNSWTQLNSMLDENNPMMQRAATQGEQFANSRGLLNSSIAAGASQNAVIDAAAPFALQDAAFAGQLLQDRQSAALQRDINAPQWLLDVHSSDMDSTMKAFLIDTVYPDGVPGVDYGEAGAPKMADAKDPSQWADYKTVRDRFDGQYHSYVADANARSQWRTSPAQTTEQFLESMGGKYADKNIRTGQYMHPKAGRDMVNMYGSYDNALRAVKMWMGDGFSLKDYQDMIVEGVRPSA